MTGGSVLLVLAGLNTMPFSPSVAVLDCSVFCEKRLGSNLGKRGGNDLSLACRFWPRPLQKERIMEVGSVSSSVTATANAQAQLRARQSEQDQQAQQALQTQRAQQSQRSQPVDESESANRASAEVERTRATVNTSGQVVGTRINTTA
jgi:hypothetical protein